MMPIKSEYVGIIILLLSGFVLGLVTMGILQMAAAPKCPTEDSCIMVCDNHECHVQEERGRTFNLKFPGD